MYREVTGSDHSDGSGNLPVHSSVPGGYQCFSFAVSVEDLLNHPYSCCEAQMLNYPLVMLPDEYPW